MLTEVRMLYGCDFKSLLNLLVSVVTLIIVREREKVPRSWASIMTEGTFTKFGKSAAFDVVGCDGGPQTGSTAGFSDWLAQVRSGATALQLSLQITRGCDISLLLRIPCLAGICVSIQTLYRGWLKARQGKEKARQEFMQAYCSLHTSEHKVLLSYTRSLCIVSLTSIVAYIDISVPYDNPCGEQTLPACQSHF